MDVYNNIINKLSEIADQLGIERGLACDKFLCANRQSASSGLR